MNKYTKNSRIYSKTIMNQNKRIFTEQFPVISEALGGLDKDWIV